MSTVSLLLCLEAIPPPYLLTQGLLQLASVLIILRTEFADIDRHISKEKHDIVTTTTIENA